MFVALTNGQYINLRFVRRARWVKHDPPALSEWQLYDRDENPLGATRDSPDNWAGDIIPAAPHHEAITIWIDETTGEPVVGRVPVVAWRIHEGYAEPVLPEPPASNESVFIACSDGSVLEPSSCRYDNLEAATVALKEEWQKKQEKH